jgi:hypothetical protein
MNYFKMLIHFFKYLLDTYESEEHVLAGCTAVYFAKSHI